MKPCHHPARVLQWQPKDEVFICRRCGHIIFPTPAVTPDDVFADLDESLCWDCGGTGHIDATPCQTCASDGFLSLDHVESE